VKQDYGATGILYDVGSVYEGLLKLTDVRKAKGKLYRLETVLMIVILAKLCGEDTPLGIAEWAQHRREELVKLLGLRRPNMPSHHTLRRIMAHVVYPEEVERLVGEYNQRGEHGEVYALDGQAVRGMRKKDEEGPEYLLSVYDVEQAKVLSQVAVGRKENEITKAPQVLKLVEISQKVVTADTHSMRFRCPDFGSPRRLCSAPERKPTPTVQKYPSPVRSGISQTWLWQDSNRFSHCPKSEQRTWSD